MAVSFPGIPEVGAQEGSIPGISGLAPTESSVTTEEAPIGSGTGTAAGAETLPPDLGLDGSQRVRAGDSLVVRVLGEPLVSGSFPVARDGRINYPLLGKISVEGNSLDEIARGIEGLLEKDYIRDAEVSTGISDRKESFVTVYGAVRQQGQIPFDPDSGLTLGGALARAGGADQSADLGKVEIQRAEEEGSDGMRKDLGSDQGFPLQDGDIVIIPSKPQAIPAGPGGVGGGMVEAPPMGRVVVMGQVNREGLISIPMEGVDILEAIAMAGGFSRLAAPQRTKVRRNGEDGKVHSTTVDVRKMRKGEDIEGFLILPGDTIFVEESIL